MDFGRHRRRGPKAMLLILPKDDSPVSYARLSSRCLSSYCERIRNYAWYNFFLHLSRLKSVSACYILSIGWKQYCKDFVRSWLGIEVAVYNYRLI